MVWSIETDDFSGSCTGTPFFWIRTIYETLNGPIVIPTPPTTPSPAPTQPGDTTTTRLTVREFLANLFHESFHNKRINGLVNYRYVDSDAAHYATDHSDSGAGRDLLGTRLRP